MKTKKPSHNKPGLSKSPGLIVCKHKCHNHRNMSNDGSAIRERCSTQTMLLLPMVPGLPMIQQYEREGPRTAESGSNG